MRWTALVPVALWIVGAVLVGLAVLTGGASFGLFVIVPFVIGRSLDLGLGVLLILGGFLSLPWAFEPGPPEEETAASLERSPGGTAGGLVIVGPVPILFGSWKNVSPRARLALAIAAAAIFALCVVLVVLAIR